MLIPALWGILWSADSPAAEPTSRTPAPRPATRAQVPPSKPPARRPFTRAESDALIRMYPEDALTVAERFGEIMNSPSPRPMSVSHRGRIDVITEAWGEHDVFVQDAASAIRPGTIDFSKLTSRASGRITLLLRNHPRGDARVIIRVDGKKSRPLDLAGNLWKSVEVPFNHKDVTLEVHCLNQYSFDFAYVTYNLSNLKLDPELGGSPSTEPADPPSDISELALISQGLQNDEPGKHFDVFRNEFVIAIRRQNAALKEQTLSDELFDVKRTDSLVSPLQATLSFKLTDKEDDVEAGSFSDQCQFTFSAVNGRWKITAGSWDYVRTRNGTTKTLVRHPLSDTEPAAAEANDATLKHFAH